MRLDTDVRGCLTVNCRCRMIGKGDESQTEAGWCVVGHLTQGVKQGSIGGDYLRSGWLKYVYRAKQVSMPQAKK